ncbi:hypothetical protein ACFLZV_04290 [Candidatus Margulisiibacteriota bacterium]
MSNSIINTRLSTISSLFNHLIDQQIVKINPATGVKRMKREYDTVKSKCLSIEEARKLIGLRSQGLRSQRRTDNIPQRKVFFFVLLWGMLRTGLWDFS